MEILFSLDGMSLITSPQESFGLIGEDQKKLQFPQTPIEAEASGITIPDGADLLYIPVRLAGIRLIRERYRKC